MTQLFRPGTRTQSRTAPRRKKSRHFACPFSVPKVDQKKVSESYAPQQFGTLSDFKIPRKSPVVLRVYEKVELFHSGIRTQIRILPGQRKVSLL
jgi:hypothetical protein